MPIPEMIGLLRSQKATEVFPDGECMEYDIEKLGLLSYVYWRRDGYRATLLMLLESLIRTKPVVLELGALPYIFTGMILSANRKRELYLAGVPSSKLKRTQGKVAIENRFPEWKTCALPPDSSTKNRLSMLRRTGVSIWKCCGHQV